ncbi:unnamed protein product [Blepharisma stoltei]|uniref:Translation elongation factor EF1B beta/delta subunit guanine nucleotide exchange domain-containing protein n=1 Tax=Blepharisma stoltei TaxID=1481888 RepID=A0AAU9K1J1_9CILI|nr:unnamed protein product [Blepharisma stoltei]
MNISSSDYNKLEDILHSNLYLCGGTPTKTDAKIFREIADYCIELYPYPNLYGWYCFLRNFSDEILNSWPEPTVYNTSEYEEFDLFANHPNIEKEFLDQAHNKVEDPTDNEPERSQVVFDIKPVDITVDLDRIARLILLDIQLDGLKWIENYNLKPVAYKINMLQMGCIIEDTIDTDFIAEKIMGITGQLQCEWEDENGEGIGIFYYTESPLIQSVDISSFQKF